MGDVGNGDDAYHNGAFFSPPTSSSIPASKPRGPEPGRKGRPDKFDFGTPDEYDFYLRMGPARQSPRAAGGLKLHIGKDLLKHPNYDEFWRTRALPQYDEECPSSRALCRGIGSMPRTLPDL